MLRWLKLYVLVNFHYALIQCSIPGSSPELSVHKLDKKLIERKRQDTMDMCRIFTEETEKLERINKIRDGNKNLHRRAKRELHMNVNPALNFEDAQRVETIVEEMYDDLLAHGEKIDYRRGDLPPPSSTKMSGGRRFDFAPDTITGSLSTEPPPIQPHDDGPPPAGKTPRFKLSIVPYFIDPKTYDMHLADVIVKAFDYFEKATCVRLQRLRERPTDAKSLQNVEWLYITNPTGIKQCVHTNERADIKGVQMMVFGYNCLSLGDIIHELMHVLGFSHEHVRPDRDQYITILWENIKPGYRKYFELVKKPAIENMPYDYASVLHYPPRAFSKNGQVTIKTEPGVKVGQREGLSEIDIEKISALYTGECVKRNREYLLKTCPSVVKSTHNRVNTSKEEIQSYYEGRLWTYGVVYFKLRNKMEFTHDERENINAVMRHIEKETCIEFQDLTSSPTDTESDDSESDESDNNELSSAKDGSNNEINSNSDVNSVNSMSKTSDKNTNDTILNDDEQKTEDDVEPIPTDVDSKDNTFSKNQRSNPNPRIERREKDDDLVLSSAKKFVRKKKSLHLKRQKSKFKKISEKKLNIRDKKINKQARIPISSARRHAVNTLVFTRSPKPGCPCPSPGVPGKYANVEINADCFNSVNVLLHFFVHILGLEHQHNSHDRDEYLHIVWDQLTDDIKKDMEKKLPPAASVGFAYDYQSVMHFPWLQIKNGRTNIMYPIWNDGWAMGYWQGLSSIDVQKLNLLYYNQCKLRREEETVSEKHSSSN